MEPIVFHASVKGFTGDEYGEGKITFKVPQTDRSAAGRAGELVGEMLIVTVVREKDVKGICEQVQARQGKKPKTKGGKS